MNVVVHTAIRRDVTKRVETLVFGRAINLFAQTVTRLFFAERLIAKANVVDDVVDISHVTLAVDLRQVVVGRIADNRNCHATKCRVANLAFAKRSGEICAWFGVIDADLLLAAILFGTYIVVLTVHILTARTAFRNLLVNRTNVWIA